MRWYRSWPYLPPAGRARVVDGLPRLLMRGCDYGTVWEYQPWPEDQPGFCLLEWDVALGADGMARFAEAAAVDPTRVLVAPYPIYPVGRPPVCAHKAGPGRMRTPVAAGRPTADSFGLGCVYLPQRILAAWWAERGRGGTMRDVTFSEWHRDRCGPVAIDWTVHPQHLR